MSDPSAQQRCLKGSIVTILDRGDGDRPLRAWADLVAPDAEGRHANRARILLEAPAGTNLQAGDDIWGIGTLHPSGDEALPDRLVLSEGLDLQQRLKGQIETGATLRAFGQILSGDTPRPGEIATTRLSPNTLLIARNAKDIPDPITSWAAELTSGLCNKATRLVMPVDAPMDKTGLEALLTRDLPQQYSEQLADSLANLAKQDAAGHWFATSARGEVSPHDYAIAVVKPYDITRTRSDLWQALSQYQIPGFMPRNLPERDLMLRFTAAHEMAHTVQESYGITHQGPPHHLNKKESFADAFALLTLARDGATPDQLRPFAQMRQASLIPAQLLSHYTGPAANAAVELAKKLDSTGSLKDVSNARLAELAAEITNQHALSKDQWEDLHKTRQRVLEDGGCFYADSSNPANPRLLQDITGGVRPAGVINAAMTADPAQFGPWEEAFATALQATRAIAYTPLQLADEDTRGRAADSFITDLSDLVGQLKQRHEDYGNALIIRQEEALDWLDAASPPEHLTQLRDNLARAIKLQAKRFEIKESSKPIDTSLAIAPRPDAKGVFVEMLTTTAAKRANAFAKAAAEELKACQASEIDRAVVEQKRSIRAEIGLAIGLLDTKPGAMLELISDSASIALNGRPKLSGDVVLKALAEVRPSPPTP